MTGPEWEARPDGPKWLVTALWIDIKLQELFWGEEGETITTQVREADSWFLRNIVKHFAANREPAPEDDDQGDVGSS